MHSWLVDLRRGRHWLRRHRPLRAMNYLERALVAIPTDRRRVARGRSSVGRRSELSSIFYYLAVATRKAGMRNRAVGSWVESARLVKRGHAARKLRRVTNAYGMARQAAQEIDDQQAFYGIQLSRYIRSKQSHRLGTRAEIDMIAELIDEYWAELRGMIDLASLDCEAKLQLFRDTLIVFPFLSVPRALKTEDVAVDFASGRRIQDTDRCVCGSGLPYRLCHGRTPGTDEILIGKF